MQCRVQGGDATNDRGRLVEDFLSLYQTRVLNNGQPMHFHTQTATLSVIDLSIALPEIVADFIQKVSQDLHGSEHFPIKLTDELTVPISSQPKKFVSQKLIGHCLRHWHMNEPRKDRDVNKMVEVFNDALHSAERQCMPLNTEATRDRPVPWSNAQCLLANREWKATLRQYQGPRYMADRIIYSGAIAKARYVK